ncbi:MAG: hypothetical protein IJG65_09595 [Synergistaceae bacterium]|nr:hypothetical protein [Synergistaceae bacterium]
MVYFPWDGSGLVWNEYCRDNYKVIPTGSKTGRAIIFFSGNGLYFPNTKEEFTEKVIRQNRYEWENISSDRLIRQHYELVILVRDVYKQWYVNGINPSYNSVDKVAGLLREITSGFEVTTCGSSAGGYAAVLFAGLMGAERFFSISGQFSIVDQVAEEKAPFVYYNASHSDKNKYYDISVITHRGGGYYLWPSECEIDKAQHELVKDNPTLTILPFKTKQHGSTIPSYCFPYLLSRTKEELSSILSRVKHDTPINPHFFAFRIMPGFTFVRYAGEWLIRRAARYIVKPFMKILRL